MRMSSMLSFTLIHSIKKKENEVEAVEGGTETAHQDVSAQKRAFLDRVIVFPVFLELLNHLCC